MARTPPLRRSGFSLIEVALALVVEWIRRGIDAVRNGDDESVSFSDGDGD